MKEKIEAVINKIRPMIQMDGGDLELVNIEEEKGIVSVRLVGACSHCPMSAITLKQGVEAEIKRAVPEVKEVVSVS